MIPRVSVIIPVYNAEKVLRRTIDSVLAQTVKDIEILLIDNMSKDNSYNICKEYESLDDRIHVFVAKEQGVSHARNLGLDNAKAEYIAFIDNDDYVSPNYIKNLLRWSNDVDWVVSNKYIGIRESKALDFSKYDGGKCILKGTFISDKDIQNNLSLFAYPFMLGVWNKLFRREIIDKYKLRYINKQAEDALFSYEYLLHAKSISLVGFCGYVYLYYPKSLSHSNYSYLTDCEVLDIRYGQMLRFRDRFKEIPQTYLNYEKWVMALFVAQAWRRGYKTGIDSSLSERINTWNRIHKASYFRELSVSDFISKKQKILFYVCKLRLYYILDWLFFYFVEK